MGTVPDGNISILVLMSHSIVLTWNHKYFYPYLDYISSSFPWFSYKSQEQPTIFHKPWHEHRTGANAASYL